MTQYKQLLKDYREIKEKCINGHFLIIENTDYMRWRDTLNYLKENEYIIESQVITGEYRSYFQGEQFNKAMEKLKNIDGGKNTMDRVFVVHGHDTRLCEEVELFLHKLQIKPIILAKEIAGGRTIIQNLEEYTNVEYAIVLYTGCDEGREKGEETLRARARQNVVFEHGYLCAKLGLNKVAAIVDKNVEIPSDLSGVVHIPHNSPDWKMTLIREMSAAGVRCIL